MLAVDFLKDAAPSSLDSIVVLYGLDRFFKRLSLRHVLGRLFGPEYLATKAAFESGDDQEADDTSSANDADLSVHRLPGKTAELRSVLDTLRTVSMWSPKTVVVIDDADDFVSQNREALERYLDRPAKKGLLVLIVNTWSSATRLYKKVAQMGLPIDCQPLKPADAAKWLAERAKQVHRFQMTQAVAKFLIELVGTDLGTLDQELAKLANYVGANGKCDEEVVRGLVGGWKAETTWSMFDAFRDGHPAKGLQLLEKLLEAGEAPLKLLGGANYTFGPLTRAAERARTGTPLRTALSESGVKPFTLAAMEAYLRRIGRPKAERILTLLLQADADAKGASELPMRTVLEKLFLQLSDANT